MSENQMDLLFSKYKLINYVYFHFMSLKTLKEHHYKTKSAVLKWWYNLTDKQCEQKYFIKEIFK